MTTATLPTPEPDEPLAARLEAVPDHDQRAPSTGPTSLPAGTLTLREASAATGASVSAMRKAIKRGRLPSVVVDGPNGPEHRVTVDDVRAAMPKATAPRDAGPVVDAVIVDADDDREGEGTVAAGTLTAAALEEALTRFVVPAYERAARAETEAAALRRELDRAREELRALPAAPAGTLPEPSTHGGDFVPAGMVLVKRRWWHRREG